MGLAAAFNSGIARARDLGATHVLLLDQDSVPAPDMVEHLLSTWTCATESNDVAACGPVYRDDRIGGTAEFVRFRSFPPVRVKPQGQPARFDVDMLISSGSLIPMAVIEHIGAMDETLFIDHVDTDWCLRAAAAGYRLLAVRPARMDHRLGDRWVPFLGRRLPLHGPSRLYYIARNSVRLYTRPHAHLAWCLSDLRRLAVVLCLHVARSETPWRGAAAFARGLFAGALGRGGPAPY